jgi:class 3 adenylate cyclase/HAMP domain-containing protein
MRIFSTPPNPRRIWWLPPIVLLVNLTVLGMLVIYSSLNLRPYTPPHDSSQVQALRLISFLITFLLPTIASLLYLRPALRWFKSNGERTTPPPLNVVERAGNSPLALAVFTVASWILMDVLLPFRVRITFDTLTWAAWGHFVARPVVAGLIAATTVFIVGEYICRTHVWPTLLSQIEIEGYPGLWKVRLAHRLFFLWLAISFVPLSAVALTALIRIDLLDSRADQPLFRVMVVIISIASSAALGGSVIAWLLAHSMSKPLRSLERAMARLRTGDFSVRETVNATDEIGAVAEGFNLMTQRLSDSYQTLETRNRELAQALDRVAFLESVKRGLDRFVPDTVRRAIEANPDTPALGKALRDVTVLFLDIENYTRLSEEVTREALTQLIERYFSLFLSDIRAEGGDINETAGDGLMILFQDGASEQHAAAAVRAALAIQHKTDEANLTAPAGQRPIAVNIGISSGECHVGSTRFKGLAGERWTFTATGPVTNLAARLGDRAKNGQILLSAETARRVSTSFELLCLGLVPLKNITVATEVWAVLNR